MWRETLDSRCAEFSIGAFGPLLGFEIHEMRTHENGCICASKQTNLLSSPAITTTRSQHGFLLTPSSSARIKYCPRGPSRNCKLSYALFATAVSAAVSCFILGFGGNLPFAAGWCAPGLGSSAYLAFGLSQAQPSSLSEALTACWWSGVLVLLVCLCGLATFIMNTVPRAIRFAIVVGQHLA